MDILENLLLEAALGKTSTAERAAFLDEACRSDAALRARLDVLLEAHSHGLDSTTQSPVQRVPPTRGLADVETVSRTIGSYKLLERIGEGGMGEVWMAEQSKPVRRRVALKLIKAGMDTRNVLARFEAEGQALALMDHPNIARVFDVGAAHDGRPYIVMELVHGIKITQYCDQNRLSTGDRLHLFIKVCQAVQHAHQKGIIHRDLKPSNILVTAHDDVPVPKVIDFGVAKATQGELTDKTLFTQFQQFLGTPAYMSPEQAQMSGLDIDTRTDIYSLGVLLYELLTGCTPFDGKALLQRGIEELILTLREVEPPPPSNRLSTLTPADSDAVARSQGCEAPTLVHLLRGDLDWIVMKCLEKDRARRYETANGLAMDIQRHLRHEPITARPPSVRYRLQKAVRRHRLAFAAGAAVALALVGGAAISTWQAIRATRAEQKQILLREQAEASREKAERAQANEAREREATAQLLYDSLLREARSTRVARRVGYRDQVFALLRQAYALDVPQRNRHDLRREALACLGDFVGLAAIPFTNFPPDAFIRMTAVDPASRFAAFGLSDGTILIGLLPSGEEAGRLRADQPVSSLGFDPVGDRLISVHVPDGPTIEEQVPGCTVYYWARELDGRWRQEGKTVVPGAFGCLGAAGAHFLAVADPAGRTLRLLDSRTRAPAHRLELSDGLPRFPLLGLSSDGRFLLVEGMAPPASNVAVIHVWDLKTDQEVHRLESPLSKLLSLGFSPDAKYVAALMEVGGVIYTADKFERLAVFRDYFEMPAGLAFEPGNTVIAMPIIQQKLVRLWNWASGEAVAVLDELETPREVAFTPDGKFLLTTASSTARLYRRDVSSEKLSLPGHVGGVPGMVFSPDGTRLVSVGKDRSLKVRSALSGNTIWKSDELPASGQAVAYSPDGRYLATSDYETDQVWIWDARSGQRLLELGEKRPGRVWSVRFAVDGTYLVAAGAGPGRDDGIRVWALELPPPGTDRLPPKARLVKTLPGDFWSLDVSPNGRWLSFHNRRNREVGGLYVWDFLNSSPPRRVETNLIVTVQSQCFTPDGRGLFLVSPDRQLMTIDAATGTKISSLPTSTPDIAKRSTGYANLRLSPDGAKLAVASASSRGVDIWNPLTGQLLYSLPEQNGSVWWLEWSPDSQYLAVSRANGDIAVWSLPQIDKVMASLGMHP